MKLYYKILLLLFFILFATSLSAENITDEILISKVKEIYSLDNNSYEIEILSNPLKSKNITTDNISIRALSQKEPLGLFTVFANIIDNDKVIETAQVRMRIKKFAEVLVLTDKVKRYQLISSENTALQKKEVTNLIEKPVTAVDETGGFRLKRNLRKGSILTVGALEVIPDIESGMETTIVYDDGFCKITALGVALQTGIAGDYIKVRNKATKKIIIARIVNEKFVAIDP